jgi:hypothetical protein
MEKITLHNYEAYLLDFSEGNLNSDEMNALKTFIAFHPELAIDLHDLSLPSLSETDVKAEFKNSLKRLSKCVSEEDLFNYLEGNLSPKQRTEMDANFVENPQLIKELENFQRTILSADKTLVYTEKSKLLKNEEEFIGHSPAFSYLENQLSPAERLDFEKTLRTNKETEADFELLKKTVLVPDWTICYENKAALKKGSKLFILFDKRVLSAVAAAILLIAGLLFVFGTFIKIDLEKEALGSMIENKVKVDDLLKRKESVVQKSESTLPKKSASKAALIAHLINKKEIVANKLNDSIIESQKISGESPVNAVALEKTPLKTNAEINENSFKVQAENSAAIASAIKLELNQITHMEEIIDEEEVSLETDPKNQLWKKAVKLAQRVNNLGLRSINGAESSNDQYLLSFNSFSIEKK